MNNTPPQTLEELHPVDRMNLNKFIDERLQEGENEWKTSDIISVALKYAEYKSSLAKEDVMLNVLELLLKKARETDYADRTEYDVVYDYLKPLLTDKI